MRDDSRGHARARLRQHLPVGRVRSPGVRQGATLPSGLPAAKNDNRLFGITAQIAWMPKPSYQLTLRTPLYTVRN
ncbi:hypothetical protein BJA5080_07352 [Bradyrhizobium diazoefficiens SEMIA 5080]|uniref:Uncharacterized protein n=1 Tax=Bradyrhizobium diazoefficiens SEMIA 5080 TaxID=754504 RepID=A0A837C684_9BRAD|nr:hypothetical protein BJA5080_07352 [Bradyrhizobium diazoefficiens SEMIA 5080]